MDIMAISFSGIAETCHMNIFLAWLYLWATFFISAALSGVVIFAYAVMDKDSGRAGPNQVYLGHYLLTILVAGAELLGRR